MNMLTCADTTPVTEANPLSDLWRRRASLSHAETERIYLIAVRALRSYHPLELRSLAEDKEELIAQFIFSRVLRFDGERGASQACAESAPSTAFALCAYFRRYLIDCLRSATHQRNVSLEVDGMTEHVDAQARSLHDPVEASLVEHGLSEASVRIAARVFIATLDGADRAILAGTLGIYSEREGGLRRVADEHRVPSYHYRARTLGVTTKKTAAAADFEQTKIGRWIRRTLGIAITADSRDVILIVLNLLAMEANG